jgi:hypothetical protein
MFGLALSPGLALISFTGTAESQVLNSLDGLLWNFFILTFLN